MQFHFDSWFFMGTCNNYSMMTILGAFFGSYRIKGNLQKHQLLPIHSWPLYAFSDRFCTAVGMWSLSVFFWGPFFSLLVWSTKAFITCSICSFCRSACLPWVFPNTMSPSLEWAFHSQLTIHLGVCVWGGLLAGIGQRTWLWPPWDNLAAIILN